MKKLYILLIALVGMTGAIAQWVPLNSGVNEHLDAVYFTDTETGYAGGWNGLVIKTTNGGYTWDTLLYDTYPYLFFYSIFFTNDSTGYFGGNGILKTTDAGANWIYNYGVGGIITSLYFVNEDIGYTVGTDDIPYYVSYLGKTSDAGATWTPLTPIYGEGLFSLYFTDPNTGYAVGTSILKTIDGGLIWDTLSTLPSWRLTSVYFTNGNTGYAVGDNYTGAGGIILKTNNGGITWDTLLTKNSAFTSIYFTDINTGYAVGYSMILKTLDAGTSWINQSNSGGAAVYFPSPDTGYVVGWGGSILKTTNGGVTGIDKFDNISTSKPLLIYPNPSNNKITISSSRLTSNTLLSIFNVSGKKVIERQLTGGQTQIDISTLPQGVYFVRLQNENMVEIGKIVKE
jgi:photosystem II stability/assembly factor-like uncharacterized protein